MNERFMTTAEVADLLRTKPETVRYWRHVEKGPKWFKAGRRVLYAREDVESFIEAIRKPPPAAGPFAEIDTWRRCFGDNCQRECCGGHVVMTSPEDRAAAEAAIWSGLAG